MTYFNAATGAVILAATLGMTPVHANEYGQCRDKCKDNFAGKLYDKASPSGACSDGCNEAHWNGKQKGAKNCNQSFASGALLSACLRGVGFYND